ncbi:MAG TPA: stalk domain-containing protein [Symbiobacteriaceae bacterium]|nr:stalk domain-containing protein [Symbiobacteriaceae bacterium]
MLAKRLLAVLICAGALIGSAPGYPAAADPPPSPSIRLDGYPLAFPVPPIIVEGRTMVPFRAIAEALGVTVIWNGENRSIQAYGPGALAYLRIGVRTMWVNGTAVELDVPPMLVNDRTLVPLRAFSTAFGAGVAWNGDTFTVSITSPVRTMRTLAFYALGSFPRRDLVPRFSDVAYGWARLNDDGSLNLTGQDYFWPEPNGDVSPESLLRDAAAAGTRRLLLVHETDTEALGMTNLILDEAKTARAADAIAALVGEKRFDGVVLDVEYLGWSETDEELERVRQGYVRFVAAVAERMRAAGKETAVSLPPLNGSYHGYDYAAIARVADTMQIMAHDYVVNQPEPTDQVDEAVRMAVAAVGDANGSKLLLGLRWYETPDSLAVIVGLAKRYSLGGISWWTLGELSDEELAALESSVARRR